MDSDQTDRVATQYDFQNYFPRLLIVFQSHPWAVKKFGQIIILDINTLYMRGHSFML